MWIVYCKLICMFAFPCQLLAYSADDVIYLKKSLLQRYDTQVRPSKNFSKPLSVDIELVFHSINDISEINQVMSSSGKLKLKWNDEYLTWNKSHFNYIDRLLVAADNIWKPDIRVHNGESSVGISESKSKQVEIERNGDVTWIQFGSFETKCSIDVTFYPFDSQSCRIIFIFLNGDGIRIRSVTVNTETSKVRDDWIIESTDSRIVNRNNKNKAEFILNIKRKPSRILLEFVVPVIMMAILDLFTFCIPCDSGEKLSYTTTMYLAFSVYAFILTSYLPQSSDNSVLAIFLKTMLVLETAIVAVTAMQLRIYHHSNNPQPPSWIKRFSGCVHKITCRRNKNQVVSVNTEQEFEEFKEDIAGDTCDKLDTMFFWFFALALFISSILCFAIVS